MPKLPSTALTVGLQPTAAATRLLQRAVQAERDGRRIEAIRLYRRVLEIEPTNLVAMNSLGAAAGAAGDLLTALDQFSNSLRIDPDQAKTWFNLGVAQSRLGLVDKAQESFEKTIALAPELGTAHMQLGSVLWRRGQYAESLRVFDNAVRLLPNDPVTAKQRGLALQWCGDHAAALSEFDRATALDPSNAEAWVSKAMLLMLLGDLPGGFRLYEWRWRMRSWLESPRCLRRNYERPIWLGETSIAGKTLLVHAEQGYGDVFQFCRYTELAAAAGARVIVEAEPKLMPLMATLPGVSEVVSDREQFPEHDFRCPMMSMPLAFRTTLETIPANVPYLRADPARVAEWKKRLAGLTGHRIGLVWGAGSRVGDAELVAIEQRKSMTLRTLAPLALVQDCDFVSLQLGPPSEQAASPPAAMTLHDDTVDLKDFGDTAALMANLDLVISVCTSTAHLAGALGKPVWLLNRFDTDWRWFLEREDSPWYPTMRIFRQPRPGDWASVVQAVVAALHQFVQNTRPYASLSVDQKQIGGENADIANARR